MERDQIVDHGRNKRHRVERVQAIVSFLTDHVRGEPFPAMSDHYKPQVDEVLDEPFEPVKMVFYFHEGWDVTGHHYQHENGYDLEGRYYVDGEEV